MMYYIAVILCCKQFSKLDSWLIHCHLVLWPIPQVVHLSQKSLNHCFFGEDAWSSDFRKLIIFQASVLALVTRRKWIAITSTHISALSIMIRSYRPNQPLCSASNAPNIRTKAKTPAITV